MRKLSTSEWQFFCAKLLDHWSAQQPLRRITHALSLWDMAIQLLIAAILFQITANVE